MPDVTLYQAPICPYARRTRMMLEHLGIPYENKQIELGNVPPSYKEVSPYGLVPAVVHDGRSVYESNIVNEYLNEVFEGELMPHDAYGRAMVRVLMAYADDPWMKDFGSWFRIVTGRTEAGPEASEQAREKVLDHLRHLNGVITTHGEGPWLYGDRVTLADITFASTLPLVEEYGLAIPAELHHLRSWVEAVTQLEAWQKVPTEYESDVATLTG